MIPACQEFHQAISKGTDGVEAFEAAVLAARKGCDDTAKMFARCVLIFICFDVKFFCLLKFGVSIFF